MFKFTYANIIQFRKASSLFHISILNCCIALLELQKDSIITAYCPHIDLLLMVVIDPGTKIGEFVGGDEEQLRGGVGHQARLPRDQPHLLPLTIHLHQHQVKKTAPPSSWRGWRPHQPRDEPVLPGLWTMFLADSSTTPWIRGGRLQVHGSYPASRGYYGGKNQTSTEQIKWNTIFALFQLPNPL